MRPSPVVPVEVFRNDTTRLVHASAGVQLNFLLGTVPDHFDKCIVAPGPFTVHAQLAALLEHLTGKCHGRELAALVGVDDL
jgi:hypothetical protein